LISDAKTSSGGFEKSVSAAMVFHPKNKKRKEKMRFIIRYFRFFAGGISPGTAPGAIC
jgi:hypothetical protein